MACFSAGKEPADWDNDPPEMKKERKGYWLTGFATGPDTTMGVLWGSALVAVAAKDAVCAPWNGVSSGADGSACTATSDWNQSLWEAVNGSFCETTNVFGELIYSSDPSLPGCAGAFASYRVETSFTCNCSGPRSDHSVLEGGLRASNTFNLLMMIALFTIAVLSPIVGTHADFSSNKLRNWRAMCIVGGLCNFGMMAMFPGGIWIIGMIFGGLTAIFTEIQLPIRSVYMEYVAKDDATRSYLGAMRQCSSYSAQTVYALVISGIQLFLSDPSIWSMIAAGLCAAWFITMMPLILRRFTEHGASRTNEAGTNIVVLTFTEIIKEFYNLTKYPEAFKFLIAHVLSQFGGPVVVTLVSTYLPGQLERSGIQVSIVALIVLLLGIGATLCLASLRKKGRLSFKICWFIVLTLSILIGTLVPLIANKADFTSYLMVLLLAGVLGAVSISWFYSIGWPSFITLVPSDHVGAYNGIFSFCNAVVQPFALLIYFAVLQATNSHPWAWLVTITPCSSLALVIMMTVNFEKGKIDAGRVEGVKGKDAAVA